ncbi:hypothetical protein [Sporosalibacterium faouarense]|uniref:hypothetical protein n=1 Tax=Sporosalibacterium faouarense TaxID=516123 RepID=UPI00141CCDD4|nr:hypothetical protein [Sporosalibacterium faouarense]MTI49355.1 hypothetical protein [Bacillota bacterium]
MYKSEIEINELNKLYDEIYYSSLEESEIALDVISNFISEKEYQNFEFNPRDMRDIIDVILDLYDEIIDQLDDEGMSNISSFVMDKKERINSREMDALLESEYAKYLHEDYDDALINEDEVIYEDIYDESEDLDNEDTIDDNFDEY